MEEPLLPWAIFGASILALVFQGVALWWATRVPHIYPVEGPLAAAAPLPSVTVVVAARNEEESIGSCLDGLLAQEYLGSVAVLVVDGASEDRTREIVRSRGSRVRLIPEPPLPPGWVGKNFACHVGAAESSSDYLLFTDADLTYHPRALWTIVAWCERERADLASFGTRIQMEGFWENVVMPFYTQAVLTYFRAPRVNAPRSRAAMANGQFMLVRRSAYQAVGGHAAVRGVVLEDVALARRFRRAGLSLRLGWAPELVCTRMYRNRQEMFEGLVKNIDDTRFRLWRQLGFLAALMGFFLAPLAVLPVAVVIASPYLALWGALLYVALFGKHAAFAHAVRGRAVYGLLFPLSVAYYLVLVGASIRRGISGRPVVWKGRSYPQ